MVEVVKNQSLLVNQAPMEDFVEHSFSLIHFLPDKCGAQSRAMVIQKSAFVAVIFMNKIFLWKRYT